MVIKMDRLSKKRKIQKTGIIIGFSSLILFVFLLLLLHLNGVRNKYIFAYQKDENFTLTTKEQKTCQSKKYTLWEEDRYHYYGYCISNIYVSKKGSTITLQEALKKKYINLEDILKKEEKAFNITLIPTYQENIEIIFSPKD